MPKKIEPGINAFNAPARIATPTSWGTKICGTVAVASIILAGIMCATTREPDAVVPRSAIAAADLNCGVGPLDSYIGSTRIRKEPSLVSSPSHLVHHPGIIQLKRLPVMGYKSVKGQLDSHPDDVRLVMQVLEAYSEHPAMHQAIKESKTTDGKGILFAAENPQTGVKTNCVYGLNPEKPKYYQEASQSASRWMQNIEQLTDQEICDSIKSMHKTLLKGGADNFVIPGQYRTQSLLIYKDDAEDQDRSVEGIVKLIVKRGATKKQIQLYKQSIVPKFAALSESYTKEELDVIRLIGYYTPPSHQVDARMKKYVKNLRTMAWQMKNCSSFDPVAFASYAHQEFGRIHPFSDGNGRMSRIIMNTILNQAGYPSVIFPSDEEYTKAVNADAQHPGAFAKYLRKMILWTEKQFDPSKPCLFELTC